MEISLQASTEDAAGAPRCSRPRRNLSARVSALIALASLAAVTIRDSSGAAQLDPEDVMVQQYQSFCLDYYTPTQCAGAVRYILRTSGKVYFKYLHNDQSMDGFLDRLASAVKGGEGLLAKEALAIKAGD